MIAKTPFRIECGPWQQFKLNAQAIREQVFIIEQGIDKALEVDGQDTACHHFIAFDANNHAVATARLSSSGKLGRLAVLKPYRNNGLGYLLVKDGIIYAEQKGLRKIHCHAQLDALSIYTKNGLSPTGEPFEEAGIMHQAMHKFL